MTADGGGWRPDGARPDATEPTSAVPWYPRGVAPGPLPIDRGAGGPPVAPPSPPPSRPPRRGPGLRVAAVVGLALLVVGTVVAIVLVASGGSPTPRPTPIAGGSTGQTAPDFPTASATTVPSTSEPTPSAPTTTAPPTVSPAGIDIAQVAADPQIGPVTQVFDTYFKGVNTHDAATAASVFAPGGSIDPTDPAQVARFGQDIATTTDTALVIRAITPTPAGLDVGVDFTSAQSPDLGPEPGETCTHWQIVYHLVPVGAGFGILGAKAQHQPC